MASTASSHPECAAGAKKDHEPTCTHSIFRLDDPFGARSPTSSPQALIDHPTWRYTQLLRNSAILCLFGLLLSACALDWDYPDSTTGGGQATGGSAGGPSTGGSTGGNQSMGGGGAATGGGGGGTTDASPCCLVCQATALPATCTGHTPDKPYEAGCPVVGWAHEVDMCFQYRACNCTNCNLLPQTQLACQALVHNMCSDCMLEL